MHILLLLNFRLGKPGNARPIVLTTAACVWHAIIPIRERIRVLESTSELVIISEANISWPWSGALMNDSACIFKQLVQKERETSWRGFLSSGMFHSVRVGLQMFPAFALFSDEESWEGKREEEEWLWAALRPVRQPSEQSIQLLYLGKSVCGLEHSFNTCLLETY